MPDIAVFVIILFDAGAGGGACVKAGQLSCFLARADPSGVPIVRGDAASPADAHVVTPCVQYHTGDLFWPENRVPARIPSL